MTAVTAVTAYLALILDMSGVLLLTPGPARVCVNSSSAEVLILSLGRERLPEMWE